MNVRDEYWENVDKRNCAITAHVSVVFRRADDITPEEKNSLKSDLMIRIFHWGAAFNVNCALWLAFGHAALLITQGSQDCILS